MHAPSLIAFNLLFIDDRPLSGPGYYAVQLFEEMTRQQDEGRSEFELVAYVQADALKHFSATQRARLRVQPAMSSRVARILWEQLVLPFVCRQDRVDLLFSPGFVSPLWGARHRVVTICDMYYRAIPDMIPRFQRLYWSVGIPLSAIRCGKILTISEHSKIDIERYIHAAKGKVVSIPLASRFSNARSDSPSPATALSDRPERDQPPFILMVANLSPNKNVEVVVEAIAALRGRGVGVTLIHAGSDPYRRLENSVRAHGLGSHVQSVGKVSDEVLADLYDRCLAVVTASTYEGFGLPALEAQAMGAPLICSDRTALPEVAGSDALYFDPTSPEQLSQRITEVLGFSAAQRASVIARGVKNAGRFSWRTTANRTREVFEGLLGDRHTDAR